MRVTLSDRLCPQDRHFEASLMSFAASGLGRWHLVDVRQLLKGNFIEKAFTSTTCQVGPCKWIYWRCSDGHCPLDNGRPASCPERYEIVAFGHYPLFWFTIFRLHLAQRWANRSASMTRRTLRGLVAKKRKHQPVWQRLNDGRKPFPLFVMASNMSLYMASVAA